MRASLALVATVTAWMTAAHATPAEDVAKLAWMAGSWAEEKDGVTTRETWLPPLTGAMAGAGQTNSPGQAARVEHMKITAEPAGATFTAIVPGQSPALFLLRPGEPDREAVFENKAHDFPQRIIYRRCGEDLCARVEGLIRGQNASEEWRYRRLR